MATLALNIRVDGRLAVIIGGGAVALRKARFLLSSGAFVKVVAAEIHPEIAGCADDGALSIRQGVYDSSDLADAFLVIAATDDARINDQIAVDAQSRGIIVVVTDNPAAGNGTFPAVLRRGDLEIAVSTGGRCPSFAVDVRDAIAELIGSEYGVILQTLAAEREKLLTNGSGSTYNTQVLRSLAKRLHAELTENKEPAP